MEKTSRPIFVFMWLLMATAIGYSQGPAPNQQPDTDFKSQAFKLVSQGSIDQMTALLDKHPEVLAAKDERGFTPLHYAVMRPTTNMAALLIGKGADINNCDKRGKSPLHHAAHDCYLKNVQLLVSHGAALDATNHWGWTPLRLAAEEGQQAVSEFLISRGATVDVFIAAGLKSQKYLQDMLLQDRSLARKTDAIGFTPLHIAAKSGQKWAAELLLRNGAKVNAQARANWTPLHWAAVNGHTEVAKVLVANGADLKARMDVPLPDYGRTRDQRDKGQEKPTAADLAEFKGHKELAGMLRPKGDSLKTTRQDIIPPPLFSTSNAADQQQPDTDFRRQAFKLAEQGDVAQMKALLDKHPEVAAARDKRGLTPLHYAAMLPTADMAALLIAKGADVNAVGTERFLEKIKPLHVAIMAGSAPVVELLLEKGADVAAGDSASSAALAVITQTNAVILRLVLERVADINARDRMGITLLYSAVSAGNAQAVELLLARGAALALGGERGLTALELAEERNYSEVVELLKRAAKTRGRMKRNIAGHWSGPYKDLTLDMDLSKDAVIRTISDSGAVVQTAQGKYRMDYSKAPALFEFYQIASPGFKEGQSMWAMIEFASPDVLVFDWLNDYGGKAGETTPNFFGKDAAILKRGKGETGAAAQEPREETPPKYIKAQGMLFPEGSVIVKDVSGEISRVDLSKDADIQGVRCLQRTIVTFFKNGKIKTAILATDQTIQKLPCAGGETVEFYESGGVHIFEPSKNVTINGIMYLARGQIKLYDNGAVEYGNLARDTEFQGIKFKKGQQITLKRTGKIQDVIYLGRDTEIQGIWCGKGTRAHFTDTGALKMATLAKAQPIGSAIYAGNTLISLYESGKVSRGTLAADALIEGIPCAGSNEVTLWKDGSVAGCQLAKAYETFGITVPAKSYFAFTRLGRRDLWQTVLSEPLAFMGAIYAPGTGLTFDERRLIEVSLPTPTTVQGILCSAVDFYPSGKLSRCMLATNQVVNGLMLAGGKEVHLYESGKLQMATLAKPHAIKDTSYAEGECLCFLASGEVESTAAAREHYFKAATDGNDDQALAALDRAIQICPAYVGARLKRLKLFLKGNDLDRAAADIAEILKYDPGNLDALVKSSAIHTKRGEVDAAIAACDRALQINPKCVAALNNRGLMRIEKKQYDLALADLARALELKPDHGDYLNSLAWLLATCADDKYRDGKRAMELAEKSVRIERNACNLDTLAAAYAEVGRFEDAVKTQQEVINAAGKKHPELKDFNERLEWYRQKKPWRQQWRDQGKQRQPEQTDRRYVYAGIPRPTPASPDNILVLTNIGYLVGYSEQRKDPIWVAYRLFKVASLQASTKPLEFTIDARTRAKVSPSDYAGSGFNRGPLAPHYSIAVCYGAKAQMETFQMSNIIPQRPKLQREFWKDLGQIEINDWAQQLEEIWVIDGGIFEGKNSLASGIAVPDACYKIILDEQNGMPRVLAFIMKQELNGTENLAGFLTSVDEIERRTGLDFLADLPDDEENKLEAVTAQQLWLTSAGKINAGATSAGKTEINVHDSGKVSEGTLAMGVKKIYVPLFANKSGEPLIENEATAATISELRRDGTLNVNFELRRDGTLKVVNAANADFILECTLTSVSRKPVRDSRPGVNEFRLTLAASFTLKRVSSQEILCEASVIGETTFRLTGDQVSAKPPALPKAAKDLASQELARRIVEKVTGSW